MAPPNRNLVSSSLRRVNAAARRRATRWADTFIEPRVRLAVQREVDAARRADHAAYSLAYLLDAGRPGGRDVAPDHIKRLCTEVATITGHHRVGPYARQTYQALIELEWRGLGRMAGPTYNIMGKLMTATLLHPPPGPILEIGTLFGIFAAGLVRQFDRIGQTRDITLVDPLVGRQLQPGSMHADSSGSPVIPQVVRDNMRLSGIPQDRYRLIQGYSTDPAVRAACDDRQYAVVILDGDHSEEGTYEDLRWVERICADGAIVVLDDYADGRWPGVRQAWYRRHAEGAPFTLLGKVWTSGFLRYRPS